MGTPNPTPERIALVDAAGIENVNAIAQASVDTGLQFYALVALIEGESRGKNIYGHDVGGVFTKPNVEVTVTDRNFLEFFERVVLNGEVSNGVGPAQITYAGTHIIGPTGPRTGGHFAAMFQRRLRPWVPLDNITYAAGVFKTYVVAANGDWAKAATLYNAGNLNAGVNQYGRDYLARVNKWKKAFGL